MEITKFGHACFVATRNNQSVVVDPGELSPDFVDPGNVVAVVVTHIHGDHLDREKIAAILANNPSVIFLAPQEVIDACPDAPGTVAMPVARQSLWEISPCALLAVSTCRSTQVYRPVQISA